MIYRLLPAVLISLTVAVACGDDDRGLTPTASPTPAETAERLTHRTSQYTQLGDARALLRGLGLEGTTLTSAHYECIQATCPDEAPGDDSWGCVSLLPTGDPANAESLLPDDPPGWYSVVWHGAFSETYAARPEPVVNERKVKLEPALDIACGDASERSLTAAEAVKFLAGAGLEGTWRDGNSGPLQSICPSGKECPIPGVPADAQGCLSIQMFKLPDQAPGQADAGADVYIYWRGNEPAGEEVLGIYPILRSLKDIEAAVEPGSDDECTLGSRFWNPYDWVPYTDIIQPMEWRLTEAPNDTTLHLMIAIGGGCEEFERVDVEETDLAVTISAYIRHSSPGPSSACTTELNTMLYDVKLQEPLRDRSLFGCDPYPEISYLSEGPCLEH